MVTIIIITIFAVDVAFVKKGGNIILVESVSLNASQY